MGTHHADRFAALHEQRVVGRHLPQTANDGVERLPAASRASVAAIDDQVVRPLSYLGIKIVVQHAKRSLSSP